MNRYIITSISVSLLSFASFLNAQPAALPTQLTRASYYDDNDVLKAPCSGARAGQLNSYISISVERMYIKKNDLWVTSIFNSNRTSYPIAKFSADFSGSNISINKVGTATRIRTNASSADLVQGWSIVDRLPYTFKSPKLELIATSNSDSNINQGIDMFKTITTAIPDFTVATSTTAAMAVATAFDRYFLAPDRTTNALQALYEFPLAAGTICEGAYVAFSSKEPSRYERYLYGGLTVRDNTVTFTSDTNGHSNQITDVSYAIFRIKVSNRYYANTSDALSDPNKVWAKHFNRLSKSTNLFFNAVTDENLNDFEKKSANNFLLGEDHLSNDSELLDKEKLEIIAMVKDNYQTKISDLRRAINRPVAISKSTAIVLQGEAKGISDLPEEIKVVSQQLENGETVILNRIPSKLRRPFKNSLDSTENLINDRVELMSEQINERSESLM